MLFNDDEGRLYIMELKYQIKLFVYKVVQSTIVVVGDYKLSEIRYLFCFCSYLNYLPKYVVMYFTRFRILFHSLRIRTIMFGKKRIPRKERYCLPFDSRDIEDNCTFICALCILHFVLI